MHLDRAGRFAPQRRPKILRCDRVAHRPASQSTRLPLLAPAILIRSIFSFNQFYLFQAFRFGGGSLANVSFNLFNPNSRGVNGQFAVSAALNIITMLILVGFVVIFNRWGKAGKGVDYA